MFLIKRLKKFPIFDLFLTSEEGWTNWSRVSFIKNKISPLGGRTLSTSELQQASKDIITCLKDTK